MSENTKQTLSEKALELRREYYRQYRKKNPEKISRWNKTYWLRKAEKAEEGKKV